MKWAARRWARGAQSAAPDQIETATSKALDDARRFGMDAQSLAHLAAAVSIAVTSVAGIDEGVWPENVETVRAFLAVTTQFRTVAVGGGFSPSRLITMGLDYAGARAGLDAEGVAVTPELWRGLRVMEDAAMAVLNEGS